jgi:hypothetical protein
MPIHINLLAEAQIAEDLRRRDPVKRAIFFGALLVFSTLVWSSALQLEVMNSRMTLTTLKSEIEGVNDDWKSVDDNQKKISDAGKKLESLEQLSNARFLQGNFLNGLQQLNLDGVQLVRARIDQSYFPVPGALNKTNNNHLVLGHKAYTTEKIVLSLDARDVSANPGEQVDKFMQALASQPYFKDLLNKTNGVQLASLSPLQIGPDGKPYMLFTLKSDLPERNR